MKLNVIKLAFLMLLLFFLYRSMRVTIDDIEVNRYFYLKRSNTLYDGIIHDSEDGYITVKNGIHFGQWKVFHKGEFLFGGNSSTKIIELPSLLGYQLCDTILINTYSEIISTDSSDFQTSVVAVADVSFFSNDLSEKKDTIVSFCKDIVTIVQRDAINSYIVTISSDFNFGSRKAVSLYFDVQEGKLVLVNFIDRALL